MKKPEQSKDTLRRCICLECPTFTMGCKIKATPGNAEKAESEGKKADHLEGAFCAYGSSTCIIEKLECLCPQCEIYHECELEEKHYCQKELI